MLYVGRLGVAGVLVSLLIFIVMNYYAYSSLTNVDSFIYIFILFSLLTDGMYVLMHVIRRSPAPHAISCNPKKLSILIVTFNGGDKIVETIKQAGRHVPLKQIFVASDASTDNTVEVARALGVNVLEYRVNMNKAFSVSRAMKHISTPYVLLLDDDTLVADTTIPTSLLDAGYSAVAFNVLPVAEDSFLNALQTYEYRQSMQLGKKMRANVGSVGNVSGAIGLYRTVDLQRQVHRHSGQFAGEDEQRTMLTLLESEGLGVTYVDDPVYTHAPHSLRQLFRQRSFGWNLSVPELFVLYWRMIISPRQHHMVKIEKTYQLYVYLTDPLRMLFFWAFIMRPMNLILTYVFYLVLNTIMWLRMGRKDNYITIVLYPVYSVFLILTRFIGHFYWLIVKIRYLRQRLHRHVARRKLLTEYATIFVVLASVWLVSSTQFFENVKLFSQIRANRLEKTENNFNYEANFENSVTEIMPEEQLLIGRDDLYLSVPLEQGDTKRSVAYKAIDTVRTSPNGMSLRDGQMLATAEQLADVLPEVQRMSRVNGYVKIRRQLIETKISEAQQ